MHTTSGRMTNIWREIVIARHLSLFDSRKRRFKKRNGPRRKKKENGERAKTFMNSTYIEVKFVAAA